MKRLILSLITIPVIVLSGARADVLGEEDDVYIGLQISIPLEKKSRYSLTKDNRYHLLLVQQTDGMRDGIVLTGQADGMQSLSYLRPSSTFTIGTSNIEDYSLPLVLHDPMNGEGYELASHLSFVEFAVYSVFAVGYLMDKIFGVFDDIDDIDDEGDELLVAQLADALRHLGHALRVALEHHELAAEPLRPLAPKPVDERVVAPSGPELEDVDVDVELAEPRRPRLAAKRPHVHVRRRHVRILLEDRVEHVFARREVVERAPGRFENGPQIVDRLPRLFGWVESDVVELGGDVRVRVVDGRRSDAGEEDDRAGRHLNGGGVRHVEPRFVLSSVDRLVGHGSAFLVSRGDLRIREFAGDGADPGET